MAFAPRQDPGCCSIAEHRGVGTPRQVRVGRAYPPGSVCPADDDWHTPGILIEAIYGWCWTAQHVANRVDATLVDYIARGFSSCDRVFIHFGQLAARAPSGPDDFGLADILECHFWSR